MVGVGEGGLEADEKKLESDLLRFERLLEKACGPVHSGGLRLGGGGGGGLLGAAGC